MSPRLHLSLLRIQRPLHLPLKPGQHRTFLQPVPEHFTQLLTGLDLEERRNRACLYGYIVGVKQGRRDIPQNRRQAGIARHMRTISRRPKRH
jgi:hypothetical protein